MQLKGSIPLSPCPSKQLQGVMIEMSTLKWAIPSRPLKIISGHRWPLCLQMQPDISNCCLQLWWNFVAFCGNSGIITMPFAIYPMDIESMDNCQQTQQTKHWSAD